MKLLAQFRTLTFLFRRSSWLGVVIISALTNVASAIIFMNAPTIGLLFLIAAQAVGYFAPLKRFILMNLAASFSALLIAITLSPTSITFSEFAVAAALMGIGAAFVNALRTTEEMLDNALWRADIASAAAEIGIFKWDFDTDRVTPNDTLRKMFALPLAGRLFAQDIFDMIVPEDLDDVRAAIDDAINGTSNYHAEFRVRVPGAPNKFKWIEARGDAVRDGRTGRQSLTGVNIDITDRKESEEYIDRLFDGVSAALGFTDADGRILHLNSFASAIFGADRGSARGSVFWNLPALSDYKESVAQLFTERANENETIELTFDIGDKPKTFLLNVTKITHGSTSNFIPYAIDISARKEAELQNEVLVAELNHRIKNLFSVINALINLSARHATSVEDFATSTIERLSALHTAHNLGAADLRKRGAALIDIFEMTLAPWRTETPRIFISGEDQFLDASEATSWALIAHELTTNANKYGALAHGGEIHISLEGDETNWRIVWRESNVTADVSDTTKKGFGQTVIARLSTAYLNADVSFDFQPDGLQVTISARPPAS